MEKILFNLANIHAITKCKELNIDCSGTHLFKVPRKWTYRLVKDSDNNTVMNVTFHKSQVPTYAWPH